MNGIKKLRIIYLIFIVLFLDSVLAMSFQYFFSKDATSNENIFTSYLEKIIVVLVIAPIIEVFLFQYLIINLIKRYSANIVVQIFISATIFGLVHCYSVPHMIKGFLAGILYAALFILLNLKSRYGFFYVVCVCLFWCGE